MEPIEKIRANAELVIRTCRPLCDIDFGYNRDSVVWFEGFIERTWRTNPMRNNANKEVLEDIYGAFLGECIIRCHGGEWKYVRGDWFEAWSVEFSEGNSVFPFSKVSKQMENGLGDGIVGFFDTIPAIPAFSVNRAPVPPPPPKPWWRLW